MARKKKAVDGVIPVYFLDALGHEKRKDTTVEHAECMIKTCKDWYLKKEDGFKFEDGKIIKYADDRENKGDLEASE